MYGDKVPSEPLKSMLTNCFFHHDPTSSLSSKHRYALKHPPKKTIDDSSTTTSNQVCFTHLAPALQQVPLGGGAASTVAFGLQQKIPAVD